MGWYVEATIHSTEFSLLSRLLLNSLMSECLGAREVRLFFESKTIFCYPQRCLLCAFVLSKLHPCRSFLARIEHLGYG